MYAIAFTYNNTFNTMPITTSSYNIGSGGMRARPRLWMDYPTRAQL